MNDEVALYGKPADRAAAVREVEDEIVTPQPEEAEARPAAPVIVDSYSDEGPSFLVVLLRNAGFVNNGPKL